MAASPPVTDVRTVDGLGRRIDGCGPSRSNVAFKGAKMQTPVGDYLKSVMDDCAQDNSGQNASYIPELAEANPDRMAVCISTVDGFVYSAGDADIEFSIQSISKAFVYALALEDHGIDYVTQRVGVEPSGEAFNELSLESDTRRPLNPMINAGALLTHTLVGPPEVSPKERLELIRKGLSAFAGRELTYDEGIYKSEMTESFRNRAIANMLRNYHVISGEPLDVVEGYTKQCAIAVTCRDLALMAATLANGGIQPITGQRVARPEVVRQTLSVMMTCGMYNGAGDWVTQIGFPAKSGVAGGILGALPGQLGIATFSPRLDSHGNSVRGIRMCKKMSDDMGLHIMHAPEPSRSVVRRHYILESPDDVKPAVRGSDGTEARKTAGVLSLQGSITFTSAERVLRILSRRSATSDQSVDAAVIDMRQVYSIDGVARRMVREAVARLHRAGFKVIVVDPENLLDLLDDDDQHDKDCPCDAVVDDLSQFADWQRVALPEADDEIKGVHEAPRKADPKPLHQQSQQQSQQQPQQQSQQPQQQRDRSLPRDIPARQQPRQ